RLRFGGEDRNRLGPDLGACSQHPADVRPRSGFSLDNLLTALDVEVVQRCRAPAGVVGLMLKAGDRDAWFGTHLLTTSSPSRLPGGTFSRQWLQTASQRPSDRSGTPPSGAVREKGSRRSSAAGTRSASFPPAGA